MTDKRQLSFCRFDLIFLMLDPQDELYDRRLASHLVSLYHLTEREAEEEFVVNSHSSYVFVFGLVFCATPWPI